MKRQSFLLAGIFLLTFSVYFGYRYLEGNDQSSEREEAVIAPAAPANETNSKPISAPLTSDDPVVTSAPVEGIQIEVFDVATLQVNDSVQFFIPQEETTYGGVVEETGITESGSRTVIGMFDVSGEKFRFVFTAGGGLTFGTLHTPRGRYQMRAEDGIGRLVATTDLMKKLDTSKPDFIIPEIQLPQKPEPGE